MCHGTPRPKKFFQKISIFTRVSDLALGHPDYYMLLGFCQGIRFTGGLGGSSGLSERLRIFSNSQGVGG